MFLQVRERRRHAGNVLNGLHVKVAKMNEIAKPRVLSFAPAAP
jgi:hypothetical protein